MQFFTRIVFAVFSFIQFAHAFDGADCRRGWEKINSDYKQEFEKTFKEAEVAWSNANYLQGQRGDKLPGQEGALPLDAWKRSIRDQRFEIDRAARKLEEARRVYDFYERPRPTSGWQSIFSWKNPRKTWYAVDIEELINSRACYREFVEYNGAQMSIHLAASAFDREVKRKTTQMISRVTQLREMSLWLEESEIKRLAPEKYARCMEVAQLHVEHLLARDFCGEVDSVGIQRLMPFVGCMSNLDFWGYENAQTTRRIFYADRDLRSSKFFDTCRESENIEAMISGDNWRACMRRVVPHYSYPSDAGRHCLGTGNSVIHTGERSGTVEFNANYDQSDSRASSSVGSL